MANNCLVTKLKSVVENNALVEIGHMRIYVTPQTITDGSVQQKLSIGIETSLKPVTVKIVGNGYFAESFEDLSDVSKRKTSLVISDSQITKDLWFSVDEYYIDISEKYNIWCIKMSESGLDSFRPSIFVIDTTNLAYISALTRLVLFGRDSKVSLKDLAGKVYNQLDIRSCDARGNLSELSSSLGSVGDLRLADSNGLLTGDIQSLNTAVNTTYLNISENSGISGNINSLATMTMCNIFGIYGSQNIVGSLESFAEALIAAGRTSGEVFVDMNSVVTIGGVTIPNGTRKTITFSNGSYTIS